MGAVRRSLGLAFDPGIGAGLGEMRAGVSRLVRLGQELSSLVGGSCPEHWPSIGVITRGFAGADRWQRYRLLGLLILAGAAVFAGLAGLTLELAGLVTSTAAAQASPPDLFADDSETGAFLQVLHQIARGQGQALAGMFAIINWTLVLVAVAVLLFLAAQAMLEMARGGKAGVSGSMIVRAVLVFALLVPIGGFNGVQHLVLALANLGGGAASQLWSTFEVDVIREGTTPLPVTSGRAHQQLIGELLVAETCAATANTIAAINGDRAYIEIVRRPEESGAVVIGYDGAGRGLPRAACGLARFRAATASGGGNPAGSGAAAAIAQAHQDAVAATLPSLRAIAASLAGHFIAGTPSYGQALPGVREAVLESGLVDRYAAVAQTGIEGARAAASPELIEAMRRQTESGGWLGAPLVFNALARHNGAIQAAARETPRVDAPRVAELEPHVSEAADAATAIRLWLDSGGVEVGGVPANAPVTTDAVFDLLAVLRNFQVGMISADAPLTSLSAVGHVMIGSVIEAFTAVAAVVGTGQLADGFLRRFLPFVNLTSGLASGAWAVLDAPVTTLLMVLLMAGLVLAWVVPLIPFIRFLFGVAGWLFQVAEALIGAALWMVAFLSMEKDRLVPGAARNGLGLLLAVLLRPGLMVLGLMLGFVLAGVIIGYLNAGFAAVMAEDDGGVIGSIAIGPIVNIVIYAVLAYVLVNLAFAAVDRLPVAVMGWIGTRLDGASQDAGSADRTIIGGLGRSERMAPRLSRPQPPGGDARP